ncbi:glycosyltransferase family 2 protein [Hymenobacter latericus]|uniref:glycosyltransferase family 2 protein n=1 Tax=Hymenobacter sp. YIM 151858-1 TaxID=2987688 RepID=UPI002225F64C|nr:glycosyltransferase family 2 protein [Hymenobacter sp. YIM 151858-1]UYZ57460.1 glycosyltransferase family 2 protein [Hymenobacter sp. YIM 151858-1]
MPKLTVVIPCYYNENNIAVTGQELIANERNFPADVTIEYVFVDDGSRDNTWQALVDFQRLMPERVILVKLAGNVGSYNAIVAGMAYATGDCIAVTTADLQDPPELLADMYRYWQQGFKLVLANRAAREETGMQRFFSNTFHALMKSIALSNVPSGGFDMVFFDKQLNEQVLQMKERNSNVFYLLVWLGYPFVNIPYTRRKREIGKSRWTLSKKVKLLVDSILSFSFFPIRLISVLGFLLGFGALLYALVVLALKLIGIHNPSGWTALMLVVLFVSSFQMIALGVIGEYVWRGLDAARSRPLYVVDQVLPYQAKQDFSGLRKDSGSASL